MQILVPFLNLMACRLGRLNIRRTKQMGVRPTSSFAAISPTLLFLAKCCWITLKAGRAIPLPQAFARFPDPASSRNWSGNKLVEISSALHVTAQILLCWCWHLCLARHRWCSKCFHVQDILQWTLDWCKSVDMLQIWVFMEKKGSVLPVELFTILNQACNGRRYFWQNMLDSQQNS